MSERAQRLSTTLDAVRELMRKRLDTGSLDEEAEREVQMALEELEVMWEELSGQAQVLEREQERYVEFFEHAPDAYLVTDAGGSVREANRAAAELLGRDKRMLLGRPLADCVAEEERVAFLSKFVAMATQPGSAPSSWQSRIRLARGDTVPALISVRAIPLGKSGVAGLCWLIRPL